MIVKAGLSKASLSSAASQLRRYADSLGAKCDEACGRIAAIGAEEAAATCPVGTGELKGGIAVERSAPGSYKVVSAAPHSAFVEFGTGVVGQGTYPNPLPAGYGYNQGFTPSAHDPRDPDAWYYRDDDGVVHRTKGHAAQPYMAPAAERMRQAAAGVAREVFAG